MKSHLLALTVFAAGTLPAAAAEITWSDPFTITDVLDIVTPAGNLVVAADFDSTAAFDLGEDHIINGIEFVAGDQNLTDINGNPVLNTTIANGPAAGGGTFYTGPATSDLDLDQLLDSHSYIGGNPGTASLTLVGLEPGASYHVQLIGVADARSCCASRTYEVDDGQGAFLGASGKTMQRGLFQSLTGTFTASGVQQVIQLRSLDNAANNNDPGLSGFILFKTGASNDSDLDGLPDAWETSYGLNPNLRDSDNNGTADGLEDGDSDGLNNAAELTAGTNPTLADTDGDGYNDGVETRTGIWLSASDTGTDPLLLDTDGDSLRDGVENPDLPYTGETQTGSDPNIVDTDADGFSDGSEIGRGSDPGDPASTPGGIRFTILGTGTAALLGSDLTDPENDLQDFTPEGEFFNWISSETSHENYFGTEGALDIFDNQVDSGDAKWCCDPAPVWATLQFAGPVSLTHFTIASGNDTPGRDPVDWEILGSNDNVEFTPVFSWSDPGTSTIWTDRNQVVRVDLPGPSAPYTFLRYSCTRTVAPANHQLNEIEYFGTMEQAGLAITAISIDNLGDISLTWTSVPGKTYTVFYSTDPAVFTSDVFDSVTASAEATTSYSFPNPLPGAPRLFFRVGEN